MQLQNTFGAFLVAFTMVHGAPIIAEDNVLNPATEGAYDSLSFNPSLDLSMPMGVVNKRAPQKGKGKPSKPPQQQQQQQNPGSSFTQDLLTETGGGLISDGILYGVDQAVNPPAKRSPQKGGKGKPGKPPGGQQQQQQQQQNPGSSFTQDLLTETGGSIISDGILYGVDQAVNPPAKRSPQKGKGRPSKPPGGGKPQQQDGPNSFTQDLLTETGGSIISDGILYGVDQAVNPPAKRSPQKGKGKPGKPPQQQQQQDGPNSFTQDLLTETGGSLISGGILYGADQAINGGEQPVKRDPRGGRGGGGLGALVDLFSGLISSDDEQQPAKRSPKGGRFRGAGQDVATGAISDTLSGGLWYGIDQAANAKRSPKGGRFRGAGQDIATGAISDTISNGLWYGVDQAANAKRSPKGGRFRGAGQDIATGAISDTISNGLWYGVDQAANAKRSALDEAKALDTFPYWEPDVTCAGDIYSCGGGMDDLTMPSDDMNSIVTDTIAKRSPRGRGRGKGRGGDRTSPKDNDKSTDKTDDNKATPDKDSDKSTDKTDDKNSTSDKDTDRSSPSDDVNNDSDSEVRPGFRQGIKDSAQDATSDIINTAANDAYLYGLDALTNPDQGEMPVEGQEPVEGEEPVEDEAAVEDEAPVETAVEEPAKRAVSFSA